MNSYNNTYKKNFKIIERYETEVRRVVSELTKIQALAYYGDTNSEDNYYDIDIATRELMDNLKQLLEEQSHE
jgi:hypothetical protein